MLAFPRRRAPGLEPLRPYRREWLHDDVQAGLWMAAVALPVSIAYTQLAGFSPIIGLHITVLPMTVYALFGSSRQLIVGPGAATCTMLGSTLMPLAAPATLHHATLPDCRARTALLERSDRLRCQ